MVPRFRGDNVWTPAFAGVTLQETFYEIIKDDYPFFISACRGDYLRGLKDGGKTLLVNRSGEQGAWSMENLRTKGKYVIR
jgi:hypothetical protein